MVLRSGLAELHPTGSPFFFREMRPVDTQYCFCKEVAPALQKEALKKRPPNVPCILNEFVDHREFGGSANLAGPDLWSWKMAGVCITDHREVD